MPNVVDELASMVEGLQASGLTRAEIAQMTGLSPNSIWRLANGAAREPAYSTVQKITRLSERVERSRALPKSSTRRL